MVRLGRAKHERERLLEEIEQKQAELQAAEAEMRRVRERGPLVHRIASGLIDRRIENHLGRDFQITVIPGERHA